MIRRRTFLFGCGSIVAAPAIAHVALPAPAGPEPHGADAASPSVAGLSVAARPDGVLRISGWDSAADTGDAWVQIDSSWRAHWR